MKWLKSRAITGIFVTLPLVLTLYIFWTIITKLDALLVPLIPAPYRPEVWLGTNIPGTGAVAGFILMVIVGIIAKNFFGKRLVSLGEWLINLTPGVNWLYNTFKQLIDTVAKSQKDAFREAVLVEYPRKDSWCIAFVTGTTKGEVQDITKAEMVNIFLPTTPNPTSGFLLFVPRKDLKPLNMSVEQATKMIISAGIVTPPTPEEEAKLLVAKEGA